MPLNHQAKTHKMPNPGKGKNLLAKIRERRAVELRIKGWSYDKIAAELSITDMGAYSIIMRVLDREIEDTREGVPRARALELKRCDTYLAAMAGKVKKGDINAIGMSLRVAERRARLCGLDAPMKIDPLAGDGGAMAINVFRKMLSDAAAQTDPGGPGGPFPAISDPNAPELELVGVSPTVTDPTEPDATD